MSTLSLFAEELKALNAQIKAFHGPDEPLNRLRAKRELLTSLQEAPRIQIVRIRWADGFFQQQVKVSDLATDRFDEAPLRWAHVWNVSTIPLTIPEEESTI